MIVTILIFAALGTALAAVFIIAAGARRLRRGLAAGGGALIALGTVLLSPAAAFLIFVPLASLRIINEITLVPLGCVFAAVLLAGAVFAAVLGIHTAMGKAAGGKAVAFCTALTAVGLGLCLSYGIFYGLIWL